jgi:hypothetical protein
LAVDREADPEVHSKRQELHAGQPARNECKSGLNHQHLERCTEPKKLCLLYHVFGECLYFISDIFDLME